MVADLRDRFGSYGTVGVAILEMDVTVWHLRYLAVSCRVLGRGIERAFVSSMLKEARGRGITRAEALFRDTGRNRMMRVLYQIMGFTARDAVDQSGAVVFQASIPDVPGAPRWVEVR